MSKIALITGITGQDGSYLAELLLEKKYQVHGIVREEFNKDDKKNWRIKHLIKDLKLHLVSLENHEKIKKTIKDILPDEVYHLAAQAYDGHSFDNEIYTFKINLNATHYIISSVREINENAKFFFAGSSEMYGSKNNAPIDEFTIFEPKSAYGVAKVAAHNLIQNYRNSFKMYANTGILFNHESPRRDIRFVTRKISNAVAKIKKGLQKNLQLGNIEAKRDWGHAKDYVEAMWLMNQQKKPNDFIIGTGVLNSVKDFAEKAFKYVGLNYNDYIIIDASLKRKQDIGGRIANSSKIINTLNWKPKIDFETLVADMVEYDLKLIEDNNS